MKKKTGNILQYIGLAILLIGFLLVEVFIFRENITLQKKLDFYENDSIREAPIIAVTDACVYVLDETTGKIIEVDIFDELIHTTIEVGDIAIYVIDYNYTDADLINIIKKEDT